MKVFQKLYNAVYEDLTLQTAGLVVGLLLVTLHIYAWLKRDAVKSWLKTLPRNKSVGVVILTVDLIWAFILWSSMDLGEFQGIRKWVQWAIPITYILMINMVDEFLSVRALGVLLLLAAAPVLDAAFLEDPASRLLLPVLAYAWIIIGLFWVGMPYTMRDQINWLCGNELRWKGACAGGVVYGVLLLICAVAFYGATGQQG